MRNRFDHLGKQIGRAALGRSGPTEAQAEISPETQYADLRHDPDPARIAGRTSLGLLGRIASSPCLIEIYARAPDAGELRACLVKHLAHWQRLARDARALKQQQAAPVEPSLWIIAAGTPASLVAELGLALADGWPEGVYLFGGAVLRVGLVAANQLPRPDRSTLLVRLMAAGPLLRQAVEELRDLPADADERAIAGPILLGFKHALGTKPARTREEEEVIVAVQDFFEVARAEGRDEGRDEGRVETRAQAVLTVLRVRGIPVPDAARERILTEQDADRLERWLERAVVAGSAAAVLDEPS